VREEDEALSPDVTGSRASRSNSAMPTELTELVTLAQQGDRLAFDELVRATYADTYTLAYRLTGDEEDARDVVQDAYLRAFRGIKRFRGDAQFSTWMYRITANCAATHLGRGARHRHAELSDDAPLADDRPEADPQVSADAGALRERVQDAIAELPPRLRSVFVLRDVYDLAHTDIAAELGISESAAKVRLHRARRKLRERLFPLPGEAVDGSKEECAHAV
jgi:RNA polymerase sigma-70 factor, ECF subfamily